jgi:cell wall-associated NlpC family hydrolase
MPRRRLVLAAVALALTARAGLAQTAERERPVRAKPFAAFSASAQGLRDSLVSRARGTLGTRYRLGGNTPDRGLDCSGLVRYVLSALSIDLPRTAATQATAGEAIARDVAQLQPGDVLTFRQGKRISHVGVYVGEGRFIHASTSQRRVVESRLDNPRSPLVRRWAGVRRFVPRALDSLLASSDSTP